MRTSPLPLSHQILVHLTTTCPSKLAGMLTSPLLSAHPPQQPTNGTIPHSWLTPVVVERQSPPFFFFLMGHYERGHSWQQWSVPFRWSPWQRLQTERKRERERAREGSSPQLCTVWIHAIRYLCKQVAFKNGWMDFGYRDTLRPWMFLTQRGILVRMPDAVHFLED